MGRYTVIRPLIVSLIILLVYYFYSFFNKMRANAYGQRAALSVTAAVTMYVRLLHVTDSLCVYTFVFSFVLCLFFCIHLQACRLRRAVALPLFAFTFKTRWGL